MYTTRLAGRSLVGIKAADDVEEIEDIKGIVPQ